MVDFVDVVLPIASLAVFSLLTVVVFRFIRKSKRRMALTLAWFALVFGVSFIAVGNLTAKYYSVASPQPLNITLAETPLAVFSSAFMIDGISIYMAVIIATVSAVVVLYSVFYIKS